MTPEEAMAELIGVGLAVPVCSECGTPQFATTPEAARDEALRQAECEVRRLRRGIAKLITACPGRKLQWLDALRELAEVDQLRPEWDHHREDNGKYPFNSTETRSTQE